MAAGALQMWEPKRMAFDTKNGAEKIPKVIQMVAKVTQTSHGTESKQYQKMIQKGSVRASSFGIIFDQNQLKYQKTIIPESITEKSMTPIKTNE